MSVMDGPPGSHSPTGPKAATSLVDVNTRAAAILITASTVYKLAGPMSGPRRHPPAGRAVLSQLPASPNAPAVLTDCAASYEHVLTATVAAPPFPYNRRPAGGCPRQGRGRDRLPYDVSTDALQAAVGVVHGLAVRWRGLRPEPHWGRVDWIVRTTAAGARNGAAGPATAPDQRTARPDIRSRHPVALRGLSESGRTRNHLHHCDGW